MFEKARAFKKEKHWIYEENPLSEYLSSLPDGADIPKHKRHWRRSAALQFIFFFRDYCYPLSDPHYGYMRRHLLEMRYKDV